MRSLLQVSNFILRAYFNDRAAIWDETVAEKDVTRLAQMANCLELEPGATVLDVGTGTGVFVSYLLRKIGNDGKLTCLDFAGDMLAIARRKDFQGNITFICADIEDSGLPAASFDAAVCYSVFPHFENKPRVLAEIHRVLKIGGGLFIGHTSGRRAINAIHRSLPEVNSHLLPENEEMRHLLAGAGFDDIAIADGKESYFAAARRP